MTMADRIRQWWGDRPLPATAEDYAECAEATGWAMLF